MEESRLFRGCYLVLGATLLVQFAFVYRLALSATALVSLLFGLAFFAYYVRERRGTVDSERSTAFVYAFAVFTVGVAVWVFAQLLVLYVL